MPLFDVVIVGGGMTGATLALSLHRHLPDCRVAMVESHPWLGKLGSAFDDRCLALSSHTLLALSQLGITEFSGESIRSIQVSDRGHLGQTALSAPKFGVPQFGQVVPLSQLATAFEPALSSLPLQRFTSISVEAVAQKSDCVVLNLSSNETISTKLLVCADGAHSSLLPQCGLHSYIQPTGQVGVIANVRVSHPKEHHAFERFTSQGPIALLPLGDDWYSLVWCVTPSFAKTLMTLNDADFLLALQAAFGWRLGQCTEATSRSQYDLSMAQLSDFVSHRVVAVGNAAQKLHPIAGQGFNLAMRDILRLTECLAAAKGDLGEMGVLSLYRERQQKDKQHTQNWTSGLLFGFSNDYWPLTLGRNLGLSSMNMGSRFQRPLVRQAMGWSKSQ